MAEYVNYEEPKGHRLYKFGKYSFSTIELRHLSIAFVLTSLTLYFIQVESLLTNMSGFFASLERLLISYDFLMFILAFGFAFILHEFGHKFTAQNYGFISEFRADINMMLIILVIALFSPFILIAPGAVMILGRVSRRQNGIISVAGPMVNVVLGLLSILAVMALNPTGLLLTFLSASIWINSFLGIFNMLPFWVLDGKKVLAWSAPVYFSVMGILVAMLIGNLMGIYYL